MDLTRIWTWSLIIWTKTRTITRKLTKVENATEGEATKEGIGDDGTGDGSKAGAAIDDVLDLGRVDALHVELLYQVHHYVACCPVRSQEKTHHGPCV